MKAFSKAFILSRLDYFNILYVGSCQTIISRLQLVQNTAANKRNEWMNHNIVNKKSKCQILQRS